MKIKNLKKGKITVTITIGMISFILAFVIFMQFKFVQNTDITSIKNMREDELRDELAVWKSKYEEIETQLEETNSKIEEYEKNIENNEETAQLIDEELKQNKLLLGRTDVTGEGIIIYYKDGNKKVTATDLLKLVNELNLSEAEAISINDQRIVNTTEIVAVDSYIYINGERTTGPYTIKVIGNRKYLESALTGKGRLVETAPTDGKEVSIESKNNIQIQKYSGELKADNINLK